MDLEGLQTAAGVHDIWATADGDPRATTVYRARESTASSHFPRPRWCRFTAFGARCCGEFCKFCFLFPIGRITTLSPVSRRSAEVFALNSFSYSQERC